MRSVSPIAGLSRGVDQTRVDGAPALPPSTMRIEGPSPQHPRTATKTSTPRERQEKTPTVGGPSKKLTSLRPEKASYFGSTNPRSERREEHCCQRPKMDLEDALQEDPNAGLSVGTVHAAFILSAAVAVALTFGKDLIKGKLSMNSDVGGQTPQFKAFQRTYLTAYLRDDGGRLAPGALHVRALRRLRFKHEEIAARLLRAATSNFNLVRVE